MKPVIDANWDGIVPASLDPAPHMVEPPKKYAVLAPGAAAFTVRL
jgi:hypothetical protein